MAKTLHAAVVTLAWTAMLLAASTTSFGALTSSISADSGAYTLTKADGLTALTGGTSADGNGAVIQIGYFSGASVTGTGSGAVLVNPFAGSFVPLSGQNSLNTAFNTTSIGDLDGNGAGDGQFAFDLTFTQGSSTTGNSLPTAGTPLSIRFYDTTSISQFSFYNTVTDAQWTWVAPADPQAIGQPVMTLNTTITPLAWESISTYGQAANTAFRATIAVPEPSTVALILLALVGATIANRFNFRSK